MKLNKLQMHARPSYEQLVKDTILDPKDKIALPDRVATQLRMTQKLTRYDDADFLDLERDNENILKEQAKQAAIIKTASDGNVGLPQTRAFSASSSSDSWGQPPGGFPPGGDDTRYLGRRGNTQYYASYVIGKAPPKKHPGIETNVSYTGGSPPPPPASGSIFATKASASSSTTQTDRHPIVDAQTGGGFNPPPPPGAGGIAIKKKVSPPKQNVEDLLFDTHTAQHMDDTMDETEDMLVDVERHAKKRASRFAEFAQRMMTPGIVQSQIEHILHKHDDSPPQAPMELEATSYSDDRPSGGGGGKIRQATFHKPKTKFEYKKNIYRISSKDSNDEGGEMASGSNQPPPAPPPQPTAVVPVVAKKTAQGRDRSRGRSRGRSIEPKPIEEVKPTVKPSRAKTTSPKPSRAKTTTPKPSKARTRSPIPKPSMKPDEPPIEKSKTPKPSRATTTPKPSETRTRSPIPKPSMKPDEPPIGKAKTPKPSRARTRSPMPKPSMKPDEPQLPVKVEAKPKQKQRPTARKMLKESQSSTENVKQIRNPPKPTTEPPDESPKEKKPRLTEGLPTPSKLAQKNAIMMLEKLSKQKPLSKSHAEEFDDIKIQIDSIVSPKEKSNLLRRVVSIYAATWAK